MTKCALFLVPLLAVPAVMSAQQSSSPGIAAMADLPDAPSAQLVATNSFSSSIQNTTPTQQTPATTTAPPQDSTQPQAGQQSTAPAAQTPMTEEERRAQAEKELREEEQQRMLGVIPNFNTVMSGQAAPINAKEKFHLFFKSSVDPFQFVAAGADALIEQGENSYPEYKQGFEGFAKRYGAAFADGFDGNFWGNAVLPSILHQDPRYFRLGHGSFKGRLWYAIISNVRCKGDNGKWEPSYSNIFGNLIGGAISNVYYPAEDTGLGLTLERGFTVTAEGAIGSAAVEFYPDVIGYFKRRQARKAAAAAGTSAPAATPATAKP